jgi:hypothetical protein
MSIDLLAPVVSLYPAFLQEGHHANLFSILLVVEDDIKEGAVHVQPAVVVNEA